MVFLVYNLPFLPHKSKTESTLLIRTDASANLAFKYVTTKNLETWIISVNVNETKSSVHG